MPRPDSDPSLRIPRRQALLTMGPGLAGLAAQQPDVYVPTARYALTPPDFGGILIDRELEKDPTRPIGSVRFAYVQNYRPDGATAGAIEMMTYMRLQEGLLRIISQQVYPGQPPETTRTLFAGTYQYNESAWHSSRPVTDVAVGDHLLIAIGVTSINTDPSDPQTLAGLSLYSLERLENQSPNLVRIGRAFHEGIKSFGPEILNEAEQRGDFDLAGKRRG